MFGIIRFCKNCHRLNRFRNHTNISTGKFFVQIFSRFYIYIFFKRQSGLNFFQFSFQNLWKHIVYFKHFFIRWNCFEKIIAMHFCKAFLIEHKLRCIVIWRLGKKYERYGWNHVYGARVKRKEYFTLCRLIWLGDGIVFIYYFFSQQKWAKNWRTNGIGLDWIGNAYACALLVNGSIFVSATHSHSHTPTFEFTQ